MSGHSHYATIKRQKGLKDAAKGRTFSKMVRAIQIAVKAGGSPDPDANYKLRMAVDNARGVNMPKENIERAISRASEEAQNIEEVTYEGFGPEGVGILVEVATDNRNRTGQEIKNIFERGGGSLAGPGSVSYNFDTVGMVVVKKDNFNDEKMLSLIDAGVEDVDELDDVVEVFVPTSKISETKDKLVSMGFVVDTAQIFKKPKSYLIVSDKSKSDKVLDLLEKLEDHDDVQKVYTNIDIPE